jgi:hypothetical protein
LEWILLYDGSKELLVADCPTTTYGLPRVVTGILEAYSFKMDK